MAKLQHNPVSIVEPEIVKGQVYRLKDSRADGKVHLGRMVMACGPRAGNTFIGVDLRTGDYGNYVVDCFDLATGSISLTN
jgi:hypothetical protein